MLVAVIILSIILIIVLSLFIAQTLEIRKMSKEIASIRREESNQTLHAGGMIDGKLIEEINKLLSVVRNNEIEYSRKNHDINQMMTNMSHDLRTPLTSALGYVDMIRNMDLPEKEKEAALATVEKRLLRLKSLIDSFFEFSKAISSDEPPKCEELNVMGVLEEAVSGYYDDYSSNNRLIDIKCDSHRIMKLSNRSILMRVFENLIINAYKHGCGDLTINIINGQKLIMVFSNKMLDTSVDVGRMFDEFYTTDISRTKGSTGLGLAIVKQFTLILGGSISAEKDGEIINIILEF